MSGSSSRHLQVAHLRDELRDRTLRGGATTISAQIAKLILQLGSTVVLARLLTPKDFGLVVMVSAFTGLGSVLASAGLSAATVQRTEIDHRQVSVLFWASAGFGLLLALTTVGLADALAELYGEPRLAGIARVFAVAFVFSGLGVQHLALLQRQMRFGALAACDLVGIGCGVLVAVALGLRGGGYWALVAVVPVSTLVTTSAAWAACGWRPGLPARGSRVRPLLSFGGRLAGFQLLNYGGSNLDRVAIGWLWGAAPVGLYSRASQLLLMPLSHLNSPISAVAVPMLSRLQDDPQRYRNTFLRLIEKLGLLVAPFAAVAAVTADWLVGFLLGPRWEAAAPVLAILAFVAVLMPVGNALGWLFVSQGRSRDLLRLGWADLLAKVVAIAVGMHWGAVGVAAALALRAWLVFPLIVAFACRKGPVSAGSVLQTFALPVGVFVSCLASLIAARSFGPELAPGLGLAAAGALAMFASAGALMLTEAGRRAIADLRHSWLQLLDSRVVS